MIELQSHSSKTNGNVLSRGKKIRRICVLFIHDDIFFNYLFTFYLLMSHYLLDIEQLSNDHPK